MVNSDHVATEPLRGFQPESPHLGLPPEISPVSKHGAKRPQKPYGLSGTGRRGGMEVGEEGDYIPIATLTTRMTSALRWGSDESQINVLLIVRDKVT